MNAHWQRHAALQDTIRQRLQDPLMDTKAVVYHADFSTTVDNWEPMWTEVALSVRDHYLLTTRDAKEDYAYCYSWRSVSVTAGTYLLIGELKIDSPTFIFGGFGAWSGDRTIAWVPIIPTTSLAPLNVVFNVPADGNIELEFGAYALIEDDNLDQMSSWVTNVSLIRVND